MEQILPLLHSLGLSKNHSQVYLYLFQHGHSIVSVVAKRLEIKRPTVYQILESLENLQLVSHIDQNGVRHYYAEDPAALIALCERRKTEADGLLQQAQEAQAELLTLRENSTDSKQVLNRRVKYYQGLAAVTDLIDESIQYENVEVLCFGLNTYHTDLDPFDWKQYTKKRVKRNISVKSIQPDIEAAIGYKERDKKELRKTKLVPHEQFPSECEINIINDTVVMYTTSGNVPSGMKLQNSRMAEALKSLFLLAWERADQYEKGAA